MYYSINKWLLLLGEENSDIKKVVKSSRLEHNGLPMSCINEVYLYWECIIHNQNTLANFCHIFPVCRLYSNNNTTCSGSWWQSRELWCSNPVTRVAHAAKQFYEMEDRRMVSMFRPCSHCIAGLGQRVDCVMSEVGTFYQRQEKVTLQLWKLTGHVIVSN